MPGNCSGNGDGEPPGSPNGVADVLAPVSGSGMVPLAIAVMNAGHSAWIALLAKLLPGWMSSGQIDCPICAMTLLIGPLLPIPTVVSTVEIESPTTLVTFGYRGHICNTIASPFGPYAFRYRYL